MTKVTKKIIFKRLLQFLLGFGGFLILAGVIYFLFSSRQNMGNSSSFTLINRSDRCGSPSGGPTDNPIATKYGKEAYPWTDQIKWNCVYNIKDFGGSNMVDRFNAARDTAFANGGGVVYFPSGTYNFTDNLFLKNGVVMRGDSPSIKDAKSDDYKPPSQLVFPKYEPSLSGNGTPNNTAFKKIFTFSSDSDRNIGIVNLDINRAGIKFLGDLNKTKKENIVIWGIRNNNVADAAIKVPDTSFQELWMRYSDRFTANISINAYGNVLVANNRLNDEITDNYEQPGYKVKTRPENQVVTYRSGNKVPFHYGNHYGIIVNRSKPDGFALAADPKTEPGLFRKGIVIRDNWVFHTMRVGIQAAGDGLLIKDNQIIDQLGKEWWTDPTGLNQPRGAVTFENRAIDWSGWNVQIEGNSYQVYRHRVMDTKYFSVDGEGILIQECCGGTQVKGVKIIKNSGNSYIGLYKIPLIQDVLISENNLTENLNDFASIYVNANTNNRPSTMNNVLIENNNVSGNIVAKAQLGGGGNGIKNNTGNNKISIEYSCNVTVQGNIGLTVETCLPLKSSNQP